MITFKNVNYQIKSKKILSSITFNIKDGEKVLLLGKSGSGKSTIFNLLLCNILPNSGFIYYNNENINTYSKLKLQNYRKEEISIIYQKDDLFENKTVLENLSMFYQEEAVIKMIKKASLSHLLNRKLYELSGGERQRVNIIKSALSPFNVLLCDEITSALDDKNAIKIIDFVLNLFKDKTIIFISHNQELFTNKVDKIIKLENSKIKSITTVNDINNIKNKRQNKNVLKPLFHVSFINGIKKLTLSSFINYYILLICFFVFFSFKDISYYFAKQSYEKYFDYDVVFIKDNKTILSDENIYFDLSSLFIDSDLYINNAKLFNANYLPFNNKSNNSPIVINKLFLKRNNIETINSLSLKGNVNYTSNNVDIIEENNMFSTSCIYYDIKYFSKIYRYDSGQQIIINYDISNVGNNFTNNPLYEEKKEDKPYLDSNAYKDYLTFKLIFDSIKDIINYFFILILIFSILSTILINTTLMIKDIKQIAIYISRGYKDSEILLSYFTAPLLYLFMSLPFYKYITIKTIILTFLVNILTISICYFIISKRNVHSNLKEDILC